MCHFHASSSPMVFRKGCIFYSTYYVMRIICLANKQFAQSKNIYRCETQHLLIFPESNFFFFTKDSLDNTIFITATVTKRNASQLCYRHVCMRRLGLPFRVILTLRRPIFTPMWALMSWRRPARYWVLLSIPATSHS